MPILAHKRGWIITLIVVAGLAGLFHYLSRPKPVAVVLQAVDRGKVESIVANTRAGTVKACRRALLAPPTGGDPLHRHAIFAAIREKGYRTF